MTCFPFVRTKKLDPTKRFGELEEELSGVHSAKVYSYKELKLATDDFSVVNKIGEGGFGSVFKGKLKNGDMVAIKVLSAQSTQGTHEFLTEMTVISDIEHENLVKLCGCCIEGNQRILVYEYLEKNSLAQTLLDERLLQGGAFRTFVSSTVLNCGTLKIKLWTGAIYVVKYPDGRSGFVVRMDIFLQRRGDNIIQFSWRVRTRICIAVARGLAFLHEEVRPYIVHRDIKASNILLDKNLTAKISDFGLAKIIPPNMTHVSTRVAGTIGYLAPEYAIRGKLTRKADIYSFGVLLMEIVCGRCNTNTRLPVGEHYLLEMTWNLYEKRELVVLVDTFLNGEFDAEEACRFLKIGLLCTQDSPKLRPSMSTVVKMLTGEMNCDDRKITKPGFISDFMELKIKTAPKPELDINKTIGSSGSDSNNTTFSSKTSSQPTKTFTAILDRSS